MGGGGNFSDPFLGRRGCIIIKKGAKERKYNNQVETERILIITTLSTAKALISASKASLNSSRVYREQVVIKTIVFQNGLFSC